MAQFKVGDRVRLKAEFRDQRAYAEALRSGEPQVVEFVYGNAGTAQVGGSCVLLERLEPVTPLIDPAKTYQTRDGRAVRIYATDGQTEYPVHGAIERERGWVEDSWTREGMTYSDGGTHPDDLIEVKSERDVWIVWRRTDNFNYFMTYNLKPTLGECPNAVAMKRVVIAEGEGIA